MGDVKMCIWRLFDKDETSDKRYLKYSFTLDPEALSNVQLVLVGKYMDEPIDYT